MKPIKKVNLSDQVYNAKDVSGIQIGIVVSEWNEAITNKLFESCKAALLANGIAEQNIFQIYVPGAFELPVGAKMLAAKEKLDAIICLGCIIKGDTKHDEYISNAVANGIMNLSIVSGKPIIFGVLTTNNMDQALDRAGGSHGNKGEEAAITALKMILLGKELNQIKKGIGF